jgi:hypothetical protein
MIFRHVPLAWYNLFIYTVRSTNGVAIISYPRCFWHDPHEPRSSGNVLTTAHDTPHHILCISKKTPVSRAYRRCLKHGMSCPTQISVYNIFGKPFPFSRNSPFWGQIDFFRTGFGIAQNSWISYHKAKRNGAMI